MRILLTMLMKTTFWFLLLATHVYAQDEGTRIFHSVSPSVIAIQTFDADGQPLSQGSAFVVAANGVLVTNAHVLEGGVSFNIHLLSGRAIPVSRILSIDQLHDLAFLLAPDLELPIVTLGNSDSVAVGERVYAIGNPLGLENTISNGILSGIRKFSGQGAMLQTTTPVSKGSSGGVLVNAGGEVIGVTTFVVGGGQNLNFAVPSNVVADKLKEMGPIPTSLANGARPLPADKPQILERPVQVHAAQHSFYLLMNIAYSAFNAKDYEVARESFTKALEIDSADTEAITGLAQTAYALGNLHEALLLYQRATALDSTDAKAYFNCGVAATRLDSSELALRMYENAVTLDPRYFDAWLEIGFLQGRGGAYQQSLQALKQAHGLNKSHKRTLYYLGVTAEAMGDHATAVNWFRQAAAVDSGNFEVWFRLGVAHYGLHQDVQADSALARAVALNPRHGPSWLWRGFVANYQKNVTKAHEYADKARPHLTDKTDKLNCHILTADIFLNERDPDKAISELQSAQALDPEQLRVHELLSHAYLDKGDYKKAKEEYAIIEDLKQQALK